MNKSLGFTLVELVVVIVILAILAAVALPRLTNLQIDARIAKLNAARGSVAAASTMVHATLFARNGRPDTANCPAGGGTANNSSGATGTLCSEAGIINLVNGYPAVTAIGTPGILTAAGLTTVFNPTQIELQAEGYDYTTAGSVATFQVRGGSSSSTCSFTYSEPVANAAPIIGAVTTTGC
ncbi:prepilin-type N-terminal cleavage/methylation domain-containing protein [Candidatus Methylobacter oryzae]|uniref:Prepilin-type N-terminal cleavage/methylation domain-containing protein n=1 Tax=Candidatus Methylobacter oryzae TaxID=2497749 RepID=A0ABY3CCV6_9GAMM|nr:prepilin-type N-terminal cleavage/methylation domain-containing protein [Candidatus Methylobacter oryzae]TRW94324.1 prepilin-type N-terminal cleavage/methylation domain-containing protein [Candidatus Methylobacter oryzae]